MTEPDLRSAAEAAAFFEPAARRSSSWLGRQRRQHGRGQPALRRQRLGAPGGRDGARHQGRGQEPELVPLPAEGARVRDRAADRACSRAAAGSCRRRGCGTGARGARWRCAARKRRTTTATFPSPTCRRWIVDAARIEEVAAALPELPDARRATASSREYAPARVRRRRADAVARAGRLLRGDGGRVAAARRRRATGSWAS